MTQKKVNVTWQCLATIFFLTGLYAFECINKFKKGGLIYLITIGGNVLQTLIFVPDTSNISSFGISAITSLVIGMFSLIILMWYMKKWSEEWNLACETSA